MEIYLLRHGIAEDASPGVPDEKRSLTSEGRRKLRELLRLARRADVAPSLMLTSPLLRAVQTAEIAAEELKYSGNLVRTKALMPEAHPRELWEEIRTWRDEKQLLLSSHNPLCAAMAGYLLGSPNLFVDYKKGALLRVDVDQFGAEPRGVLRWFLIPKLAG